MPTHKSKKVRRTRTVPSTVSAPKPALAQDEAAERASTAISLELVGTAITKPGSLHRSPATPKLTAHSQPQLSRTLKDAHCTLSSTSDPGSWEVDSMGVPRLSTSPCCSPAITDYSPKVTPVPARFANSPMLASRSADIMSPIISRRSRTLGLTSRMEGDRMSMSPSHYGATAAGFMDGGRHSASRAEGDCLLKTPSFYSPGSYKDACKSRSPGGLLPPIYGSKTASPESISSVSAQSIASYSPGYKSGSPLGRRTASANDYSDYSSGSTTLSVSPEPRCITESPTLADATGFYLPRLSSATEGSYSPTTPPKDLPREVVSSAEEEAESPSVIPPYWRSSVSPSESVESEYGACAKNSGRYSALSAASEVSSCESLRAVSPSDSVLSDVETLDFTGAMARQSAPNVWKATPARQQYAHELPRRRAGSGQVTSAAAPRRPAERRSNVSTANVQATPRSAARKASARRQR